MLYFWHASFLKNALLQVFFFLKLCRRNKDSSLFESLLINNWWRHNPNTKTSLHRSCDLMLLECTIPFLLVRTCIKCMSVCTHISVHTPVSDTCSCCHGEIPLAHRCATSCPALRSVAIDSISYTCWETCTLMGLCRGRRILWVHSTCHLRSSKETGVGGWKWWLRDSGRKRSLFLFSWTAWLSIWLCLTLPFIL